jgi:hypothetical protein
MQEIFFGKKAAFGVEIRKKNLVISGRLISVFEVEISIPKKFFFQQDLSIFALLSQNFFNMCEYGK